MTEQEKKCSSILSCIFTKTKEENSNTAYLRKKNSVHIWTVLEGVEDSSPLNMAEQNQ